MAGKKSKQVCYIYQSQQKKISLLSLLLKLEMRPSSHKSSSSNRKKLLFQTKLKSRVNAHQINSHHSSQDLNASAWRELLTTKNKHNHTECEFADEEFNQSACKLEQTNFSHHTGAECLCNQCSCGRHLCKLHVIKPDLTKATVYQKSFKLRKGKPVVAIYARQYDRLKAPHLQMTTTYHQGFQNRTTDQIQRPRPQDLIHSQGPMLNLTSYSSQFPGHRGPNQYVKPTDRHFRGDFPLRSKSTYSDTFSAKRHQKDDYKYIKDQLKTGKNWYGTTSYGNFFSNFNPEYFAKPVKIVQKKQENPDYSHQYQTTYKNHFIEKDNPQCPAKVYLQTRAKGSFSQSKAMFNENSDFKALSPNFHAISTAKHSYV